MKPDAQNIFHHLAAQSAPKRKALLTPTIFSGIATELPHVQFLPDDLKLHFSQVLPAADLKLL